ncbi:enoyl-CoA hydratase/isomerase family protein, partial [Enterococcus faecium]
MAYETISLSLADHVATLTLNRPDRLNALSVAMIGEMRQAVAEAVAQGARCLLITGAGRGFCAGADLSQNMSADGGPPDLGAVL